MQGDVSTPDLKTLTSVARSSDTNSVLLVPSSFQWWTLVFVHLPNDWTPQRSVSLSSRLSFLIIRLEVHFLHNKCSNWYHSHTSQRRQDFYQTGSWRKVNQYIYYSGLSGIDAPSNAWIITILECLLLNVLRCQIQRFLDLPSRLPVFCQTNAVKCWYNFTGTIVRYNFQSLLLQRIHIIEFLKMLEHTTFCYS